MNIGPKETVMCSLDSKIEPKNLIFSTHGGSTLSVIALFGDPCLDLSEVCVED